MPRHQFTARTLLIVTAAMAFLSAGYGVLSSAPFRALVLFAIGGSVLFIAVFGNASKPWQTAVISLLGALLLSLCFTFVFNLRPQSTNSGEPVLRVGYLFGTLIGGTLGFVLTLPFLLGFRIYFRSARVTPVHGIEAEK